MIDAALWGLIQGLTEFLPISSSGHLVLVPALLDRSGPDLATTAVLHIGTLAAAVAYFRADVAEVIRFTDQGRRLLRLLVVGTIPAVAAGVIFRSSIETISDSPTAVAGALFVMGFLFVATRWIPGREGAIASAVDVDAAVIGLGQAAALIPGVSRSGSTIAAGLVRGLNRAEAARFSFLLGIPVIAGAGLLQFIELAGSDEGVTAPPLVGALVAAVAGYFAIAFLLRVIERVGLVPFGIYGLTTGAVSWFLV